MREFDVNGEMVEILKSSKKKLEEMIKGYKKRITMQRKIMQQIVDNNEPKTCPLDSDYYNELKMLYNLAIDTFTSKGGVYKRSRAEEKELEFNKNIQNIATITYSKHSFDSVEHKTIVSLYPDLKIKKDGAEFMLHYDFSVFLDKLYHLWMGEWKKEYVNPLIVDGVQWEIEIEYKNGGKALFSGSNAYPFTYREFLGLIGEDYE